MTYPYLSIDLAKVEHNARVIVGLTVKHAKHLRLFSRKVRTVTVL